MADDLKQLTAVIVSSYVEANKIAPAEVPALISSTYAALDSVRRPAAGVLLGSNLNLIQ